MEILHVKIWGKQSVALQRDVKLQQTKPNFSETSDQGTPQHHSKSVPQRRCLLIIGILWKEFLLYKSFYSWDMGDTTKHVDGDR